MFHIEKLCSAGNMAGNRLRGTSMLPMELDLLYRRWNGIVMPEGELLVRPWDDGPVGLSRWNDGAGWVGEYGYRVDRAFFFAENVFGEQYAVRDGAFWKFWPESGRFERVADDLEGWAQWIYSDYQVETGYPFAREFQAEHGRLRLGQRVGPKIPFCLGGDYSLGNFYAATDTELMSFRAHLCKEIEGLPDGAEVELRVTE